MRESGRSRSDLSSTRASRDLHENGHHSAHAQHQQQKQQQPQAQQQQIQQQQRQPIITREKTTNTLSSNNNEAFGRSYSNPEPVSPAHNRRLPIVVSSRSILPE